MTEIRETYKGRIIVVREDPESVASGNPYRWYGDIEGEEEATCWILWQSPQEALELFEELIDAESSGEPIPWV